MPLHGGEAYFVSEVMSMRTFTHNLYVELRWLIHDRLAHPVSQGLRRVGLVRLANWVHDATVPVTMAELADDDGAVRAS
jgi:hypothetical protein